MRESPVQQLMVILEKSNVSFEYHDPHVPECHNELNGKVYHGIGLENLEDYDAAIIITDHSCFDYQEIVNRANLLIDTRNATKGIQSPKIVLL
jgi:UDP-N-acetyl-D-glucosamine dehydrogenase